MTSGDAQAAIVQCMSRSVLDLFRRPISNGKARTKVAVRQLRQMINAPRQANYIGDYDVAAAGSDSNIAKFVVYRGQDTLPAQEDRLDAYYHILPAEVKTFAQLRIDEVVEPDGFREEMETCIYSNFRETKTTKFPLANIMQEVQDKLLTLDGREQGGDRNPDTHDEQVQYLRNMFKGKGKTGKRKGKGPNGGTGC